MRRTVIALLLTALPVTAALASEGGAQLEKAPINLGDGASLQRGAKYFVNYCSGCHSAKYMRYSRLAHDLGLTEAQVEQNLMFTAEKIGEPMTTAMKAEDGERWFGVVPPDLSVIARSRGVDWLYTYLRAFYQDEDKNRRFGVNNLVFKDVAMPHVLVELQGLQVPVYKTVSNAEGHTEKVIERLEQVQPGALTPEQYDRVVADLVNFLAYVGEPAKPVRQQTGIWVLLYLAIFGVLAYALKKEYWKDVH
jgi:ubiquinol-cytochrome c reductase cytochrome c1 subunit